jgi:hypothetical protein
MAVFAVVDEGVVVLVEQRFARLGQLTGGFLVGLVLIAIALQDQSPIGAAGFHVAEVAKEHSAHKFRLTVVEDEVIVLAPLRRILDTASRAD